MECPADVIVKTKGKWHTESVDSEDNQDYQVLGLQESVAFKPRRKIPPVTLTKSYFVERGVCGEGAKPERIRLYKQVTLEQCEALFGKAIGERKKFDYKACKSGKLRAKIEKLWPRLHSKKEMRSGIRSHSQKGKVAKQGLLSLLTSTGSRPPGLRSAEVEDSNGTAFTNSFSKRWDAKLGKEICKLLTLYTVECRASMELATRLKIECVGLMEQARLELAMRDSLEAKADLKAAEICSLEALEFGVATSPLDCNLEKVGQGFGNGIEVRSADGKGDPIEGIDMATASSPIAGKPLVLESNHLMDCRTIEKCYRELVAGHNMDVAST
jgi:hypothetical protein